MSKAEPAVSVSVRVGAEKPWRWTVTSYRPTRRYEKRNRPSLAVTVSDWMFVSLLSATTSAPGTTAPCGSITRPLTLAELTVSCANAATPIHKQHTHANTTRIETPPVPRSRKGRATYRNRKPTTKDDVRLRAGRRRRGGRDSASEIGDRVSW